MNKILFTACLLTGWISMGQDCSYGTMSENSINGSNISTGGAYEYSGATDFDIPFGTLFSVEQVSINVLKGTEDLTYVNVYFLEDLQGKPGEAFQTFENVVPVNQELIFTVENESFDGYTITLDIPVPFDVPKGKYYLQVRAATSDGSNVFWEITDENTTSLGRFDYANFGDEPWFGGFSYYDYVFQVSGTCSDTGEEQPDYGDACAQEHTANNHETGLNLRTGSLADDFFVAENTTFHLNHLKISTLQIGNVVNASIKIRNSVNDAPGDIVYSVENKAPITENFFGYWPYNGFPLDVVAVDLEFEFEPIELAEGHYFVEVSDVVYFQYTDFLAWEAKTTSGIGGSAYESYDGETWTEVSGFNLVFDVSGYCEETLGVEDFASVNVSVYPNPVTDRLHINTLENIQKITLVNALGQSIRSLPSHAEDIAMASLPNGLYILTVELANGKKQTFKIVKH
ncbi:T9SS type A sorting domain-containing protein [Bizionia arctica]|uniref:Secretion system C-terminal sorting domain-containing protein n=1 Tax=Bizionia arctica TaxID=1495645 RepID=A0A917GHZ1_9FLAO|nr:T9SS type A sorting domain-containing protein [Bizionia arctica]GGG46984.1 hypothetical protein GCM10010976_18030 [Bizionia arctica]